MVDWWELLYCNIVGVHGILMGTSDRIYWGITRFFFSVRKGNLVSVHTHCPRRVWLGIVQAIIVVAFHASKGQLPCLNFLPTLSLFYGLLNYGYSHSLHQARVNTAQSNIDTTLICMTHVVDSPEQIYINHLLVYRRNFPSFFKLLFLKLNTKLFTPYFSHVLLFIKTIYIYLF